MQQNRYSKTKNITSNRPNLLEKEGPDIDSVYDFIGHTYGFNISKELMQLIIEELITESVIFNQKNPNCSRSWFVL